MLMSFQVVPPSVDTSMTAPSQLTFELFSNEWAWSNESTRFWVVLTSSAGETSAVSEGLEKSMPAQTWLGAVTSVRDQILPALVPVVVHAVVLASTSSVAEGIASTLR